MTKHPLRWALAACSLVLASCGSDDDATAVDNVRARIAALAPAANIGHRGAGSTSATRPYPENSLSSIEEAMRQGADGVEIDIEITADGGLLLIHDDLLEVTTSCSGCVSEWQLSDILTSCSLLDGNGEPLAERPPTLAEALAALPPQALVNVELKTTGQNCRTDTTGADDLARAAVDEVRRLGFADRAFFSSFSREAIGILKDENPDLYAAYLYSVDPEGAAWAIQAGLDAIHPFFPFAMTDIAAAHEAGLQTNVWTVNDEASMGEMIDLGVDAIITDEPAVLRSLLSQRAS